LGNLPGKFKSQRRKIMLLINSGITMEATDPSEINRLKRAGYVEVKEESDINENSVSAMGKPKRVKDDSAPPADTKEG
jgi:hypothetical protein